MSLSHDDRLFLDYIEKKCHSRHEMRGDRHRRGPVYHDDYHPTKLTEDEIKRVIAIAQNEDNEILLTPNSTTFGFSGPAYCVYHAVKVSPFIDAEFTALVHFSQPQMPDGWDFARMVPFFASERFVTYYGMHPFSRNISPYIY